MKRKTVLILVNHEIVIYNFRKELVERLLKDGYEVVISSPMGEKIGKLVDMGCEHYDINIDRHGINPLKEIKLIRYYNRLVSRVKPDIILTYTVKPNIYGGMAAKKNKVPYIANITGLGTAVEKPGILQKILIRLYKKTFTDIQTIFFQNLENQRFFAENSIGIDKHELLPGSGVNLKHFQILEYPPTDETIEFVFVSRIMKEKGINQYLEAAKYITKKYPQTKFHIAGFCEEEFEDILKDYQNKGIIIYHGMVKDIRDIFSITHCTVHPTYYPEGLSNVLLESAASGRPIISTNRSGCRETIEDNLNGYLVKERNVNDLINKIEKFIVLNHKQKRNMGLYGRKKVEKEFDRQIVIDAYISEIKKVK